MPHSPFSYEERFPESSVQSLNIPYQAQKRKEVLEQGTELILGISEGQVPDP
jgi:hypothetical protein